MGGVHKVIGASATSARTSKENLDMQPRRSISSACLTIVSPVPTRTLRTRTLTHSYHTSIYIHINIHIQCVTWKDVHCPLFGSLTSRVRSVCLSLSLYFSLSFTLPLSFFLSLSLSFFLCNSRPRSSGCSNGSRNHDTNIVTLAQLQHGGALGKKTRNNFEYTYISRLLGYRCAKFPVQRTPQLLPVSC